MAMVPSCLREVDLTGEQGVYLAAGKTPGVGSKRAGADKEG